VHVRVVALGVHVRVVALAVALAGLAAACGSASGVPSATGSITPAPAARSSLGEQRSEAAAVTLVASWLDTGTPAAQVAMDTHSVDLDGFDLKTLARVRLDGGAWAAPTAWDAPKGGHHREGTLAFATLDRASLDAARIVELEIRDLATPSRVLRWERPR